MVTQLVGFGGRRVSNLVPASVGFLQYTEITTNLTTYNFATVNFGAADATRRIVIAVHWGAALNRTLNSASIGGVGATTHIDALASASTRVAIISALVPTGTSGTVSLTFSGACAQCAIGTYRALNETSASPTDTANDLTVASGLVTDTINVPTNGWVVAGASFEVGGATTTTWTGVTETYDIVAGDSGIIFKTGGSQTGLSSQTGRTISAQNTDTSAPAGALVAVSWG
jgi:hypothetical protein